MVHLLSICSMQNFTLHLTSQVISLTRARSLQKAGALATHLPNSLSLLLQLSGVPSTSTGARIIAVCYARGKSSQRLYRSDILSQRCSPCPSKKRDRPSRSTSLGCLASWILLPNAAKSFTEGLRLITFVSTTNSIRMQLHETPRCILDFLQCSFSVR